MSSAENLLQLCSGYKSFGSQHLFEDASFSINEGEHVGVIGPNGAGKTTLFKILLDQEPLDSGEIIRSQKLKIGYLSQHDHWGSEETGNQYLEKTCSLPVWQAKSLGKELQVSEETFEKPIMSLSGGYRMRIKLIGLLGKDPNLMLLDEPTNYLDLETTLLLERFLQSYTGAFLLISHDREVLRRTTDHTLEVEAGEMTKFNGNIDDYFEQKELLRNQLQAQAQNQALKRKAILDFVNRFGAKATKAKQAQSKLKNLQKMETIDLKPVPIHSAIKIPAPIHVGKSVLRLEQASFGYQNKVILNNINFEIRKGDHIAVVGLNGAGKSTLLKGLAGTLNPLRGMRHVGANIEVGIFNQHVTEVLNPDHSVFESLEESASKEVTHQEIRNMAGSLLFSANSIEKKIKVLSGGEKSRVALGRILLKKVPFLLLDEPTNHLDFQTVESLTQALSSYEGTLVVVSHDRSFIKRIGTKILEVSLGQVHLYPGTYDDYVWSLQQNLSIEDTVSPIIKKNSQNTSSALPTSHQNFKEKSKRLRQLEKELSTCESQISNLENQNTEINEHIVTADPAKTNINESIQKMTSNSESILKLEQKWVELSEEFDLIKQSFQKEKE